MTGYHVAIVVTSHSCLSLNKFLSVLLSALSTSCVACLICLCLCLGCPLHLYLLWPTPSISSVACLLSVPESSTPFAFSVFCSLSAIYMLSALLVSFMTWFVFVLYNSSAVYASSAFFASSVTCLLCLCLSRPLHLLPILCDSSAIYPSSAPFASSMAYFVCVFCSTFTVSVWIFHFISVFCSLWFVFCLCFVRSVCIFYGLLYLRLL